MTQNFLHNDLLIQLLGFAAFILSVAIFQFNSRSTILRVQMSACFLYALHFFLLGAYTGAAMNVAGIARNYSFDTLKKRQNSWLLPAFFVIIFVVAGLATWQGPRSLLPVLASVVGTLAVWQQNPRGIRLLSLVSPPLWLAYNILSRSYPGIASEVLLLMSTVVGVYRFDISKKMSRK